MGERDWNNRESRDWNSKPSGPGWDKPADEKAIGTIDDYELLRELGTGGFGSVYLARDTVSRTFVAVKGLPQQVNDSAGELERIRANFALVSKLKHPNVAAVLGLHRVGAVACGDSEVLRKLNVKSGDTLLVMDYAPGVTLDSWCRQFPDRRVPVDQAIEVTRQIAAALDVAHKMKIVHRDIKPQNVMVETLSGGSLAARVLDFGLAAEVRSSMRRVSRDGARDEKGGGDSSGTLQYMAPEQLEGRLPRSAMDQYALAALFYEMVAGDVPFSSVFDCGDRNAIINVITTKAPEIPRELPRTVRRALARALAKRPEKRFASCGDFVAALQGAVRVRRGLVAGILAAVAVAGAGAWWLGQRPGPGGAGSASSGSLPITPSAPAAPTAEQIRAQELAAETAVYDLMRDMESAKRRIAAESEEVRSLFAAEIRAFEKKFESAQEAKSDSRLVIATNFLVQAKAQADALRKLVDARKDKVKAITGEFNRLCDAKEWDKAHKLAQDADKTDSTVQNNLGKMYAEGYGVAKDDAEAVKWYRKAAEQGDVKAQYNLGWMYEHGRGVEKDDAQMVKWYRQAAEQGDAVISANAMIRFATYYYTKEKRYDISARTYQDFQQRFPQHDKAARALFMAGCCYIKQAEVIAEDIEKRKEKKENLPQGYQQRIDDLYHDAVKDFGTLVETYRDSAPTWLMAQTLYWAGDVSVRCHDYDRAYQYLKRVVAEFPGTEWARRAQGLLLEKKQAFTEVCRKAAEGGDADAQFNLGWMCENGSGVAQDVVEAVKWYRKAAEQGHAGAQCNLGVMYANGNGVAKDDAEAVKWYRKAAEQGDARAQYYLGQMYANGCGVAKDDAQAVEWYRKAAGRGSEAAQKELQRLGK